MHKQDIEITVKLVEESFRGYKIHNNNYDCSEIAEDLYILAAGIGLRGEILRLKPKNHIDELTIIEYDREINVIYHDIFVLKGVVYDPRYSRNPNPIPLGKYIEKIGEINMIDVVVKLAD